MTLSYELCKQLRDAGLPQEQRGIWAVRNNANGREHHQWVPPAGGMGASGTPLGGVACPSSDELLHAMQARWPDNQVVIELRSLPTSAQWSALMYTHGIQSYGTTPVEALARLWLSLAQPTPT